MVQIKWTTKSKNDLKSIYNFISQNSEFYAEKTVTRLISRTEILRSHSEIGRIVPEFRDIKLRELFEGNYRIVYSLHMEDLVQIITIFHSSRDISKLKIEIKKK